MQLIAQVPCFRAIVGGLVVLFSIATISGVLKWRVEEERGVVWTRYLERVRIMRRVL